MVQTDRSSLATMLSTCRLDLPYCSIVDTTDQLSCPMAVKLWNGRTKATLSFGSNLSSLHSLGLAWSRSYHRACGTASSGLSGARVAAASASASSHYVYEEAQTFEEAEVVTRCWRDRYLSRRREERLCICARTSERKRSWCT